MASVSYAEDLACSVCLTIFTDPVTLPCGHSFCRQCITKVLNMEQHCPQCRTAVAEATSLPTSLILQSLAKRAKEEELKKGRSLTAEVAELCPEHEENLKLFCITDQQLACIICRDGEEHEGHRFKPVKEAAASLRKELQTFQQHAADDIHAIEGLADIQKNEMLKTRERSQKLTIQIRKQFQEMHDFLRRRENEIKTELKHKEEDSVGKMREALEAIDIVLSDSRELKEKVNLVLKIPEPENFLKSWTEGNKMGTAGHVFRPRLNELQVVNSSFSLGPYESHLQFFLWKEMLQMIQPRAELLTLKSKSPDVVVSDDRRSLFCKPKTNHTTLGTSSLLKAGASHFGAASGQAFSSFGQPTYVETIESYRGLFGVSAKADNLNPNLIGTNATLDLQTACSDNEFGAGQYYWEIEVGSRDYWELGIIHNFLKFDGVQYATCGPNVTKKLQFQTRPRKIGVYFDCPSKELSFYDADTMKKIHSVSAVFVSMPVSAQINIKFKQPDHSPITVCWY
ncbi:nuclear factor 7, ovary [Fundulus heteroclitus]|uniref:nuclear factor 7, ovary n=1 Tax=Fundulus heteroclitus TaxID=8078 RepID=UPI00165AF9E2|nr:nuclear factor 7, ovary [Fundulus heteroclitus]